MNEKFLELPKEKQLKIINAGMEYFGKYGYKSASTDDIAARAEISKGLLFYYFHNKKSFYLYLYDYCAELMLDYINSSRIQEITDFFDIMDCGAALKMRMIVDYPYPMSFVMKAYYSHKEAVTEDINHMIDETISTTFDIYFKNTDWSKFRDEIDPQQIYQMLLWMIDGYMLDKQRTQQDISVEDMLVDFNSWKNMFKKMCYKEEYL